MGDVAGLAVRDERPDDIEAVRAVNRNAFAQDQEGRIVDALRDNGAVTLSLVATRADAIVGHILFSPITVGDVEGAALGPMAVVPECQRHGIGSRLVEAGIERLARAGCPFVIVLGHSGFYPRFGFEPASRHGITCEWDVPDDVFMVLPLDRPTVSGLSGLARYRPEFSRIA